MPTSQPAAASALGLALGHSLDRYLLVMEQKVAAADAELAPEGPDLLDRERQTRRFASLLIARWLVSGVEASDDEANWISEMGKLAAASGMSLAQVARHYFIWRDVSIYALEKEGERLETPPDTLRVAVATVRASCDASLFRLIRDFDSELSRLRQLVEAERATLRHQALHDPLTGAANRALFYDRLDQLLARHRRDGIRFAILLMDLDHFKKVNDTFGHPAGDALLTQVTGRLLQLLRATDTLARWGGDEFAMILPGARRPEAASVIARLRQALRSPFVIEGTRLITRASVGIAICPDNGLDPDTLIRCADLALYREKANRLSRSRRSPIPNKRGRLVAARKLRKTA